MFVHDPGWCGRTGWRPFTDLQATHREPDGGLYHYAVIRCAESRCLAVHVSNDRDANLQNADAFGPTVGSLEVQRTDALHCI